jgi:hypothetical protein
MFAAENSKYAVFLSSLSLQENNHTIVENTPGSF